MLACIVLFAGAVFFALTFNGQGDGSNLSSQPVILSEILAGNRTYIAPNGQHLDFVEIRNTTDSPVDISGYMISDRPDFIGYTFPKGTVIQAHSYLVCWCDKESDSDRYGKFGISRKGDDTILLYNHANVLVDQCQVPVVEENVPLIRNEDGSYRLADTIESSGSAFDRVEYVRMNNRAGYELVVGCQVSDQVLGSLSVYTMVEGQMELVMSSSYTEFLCTDLTRNGLSELFVLRPGQTDGDNGIAELYSMDGGSVERSAEMNMSRPADKIKRMMIGKLNDGVPAVYVASDVDSNAIITDVFALVDGAFTNVSFSSESGTSVQTLRNYYVYADDIDGVLELPSLVTNIDSSEYTKDQYVIRWFALKSDGTEVDKRYTYHNFVGGWYLELDHPLAPRFTVQQLGNTYEFFLWNEEFTQSEKILSVHILTGQKREEQAAIDNRFILHRGDTTIYAARLEVAADKLGITREKLAGCFHLILKDWNTGET